MDFTKAGAVDDIVGMKNIANDGSQYQGDDKGGSQRPQHCECSRLDLGRVMPNIADGSQGRSIHGVFDANQNNGVFKTEDDSQVEKLFTQHFQGGANHEIRNFRGRNREANPLFFAAFHAARKGVPIWQLPDRHPFILFRHRLDYSGYPQRPPQLREFQPGSQERHVSESRDRAR